MAATPPWCNSGGLNVSETAICSTPTLGVLDQKLDEAYAAARGIRRDLAQAAWLEHRNACGWDIACLDYTYRKRISELSTITQMPPPDAGGQSGGLVEGQISVTPLPAPTALHPWPAERENTPWSNVGPEISGREERAAPANAPGLDPAAAALPVLDDMTPRPWCERTRLNETERAVCGNRDLSRLDALLELVYGRALARDEDRAQLQWLRSERDDCDTDIACIALAYKDRIEALNAPFARDAARRYDIEIPAGHFPPPGSCRLWYPERPPGQQPPPTSCNISVPAGAVLIRG